MNALMDWFFGVILPWGIGIGGMFLYLLIAGYLIPPHSAPDNVSLNMLGFLMLFTMGLGYRLGADMNPFDFGIRKTKIKPEEIQQ